MEAQRILIAFKECPPGKLVAFTCWSKDGYRYVSGVRFSAKDSLWKLDLVTSTTNAITVKGLCSQFEQLPNRSGCHVVADHPSVKSYGSSVDYVLTAQLDGAIVLCFDDGTY